MKSPKLLIFSSLMLVFFSFIGIKYYQENTSETTFENLSKVAVQSKNASKNQLKNTPQNGDIIFQISVSGQGKAIQLATKSVYTHCGIIYTEKNKKGETEYFVFEAIQPVVVTPLQEWINRGDKNHFVIKRLKNASQVLTNEVLSNMKDYGKQFLNKDYDIYFGWSDERIYCSELVWKIYKNGANIEVGKLEKLKSFDLSSKEVKKIMHQRYGNPIPTKIYEQDVISPASIFDSPLLEVVPNN